LLNENILYIFTITKSPLVGSINMAKDTLILAYSQVRGVRLDIDRCIITLKENKSADKQKCKQEEVKVIVP